MKAVDKKFYNIFWSNQICQQIFSVHKTQLLENEVELILSKEKFLAQRLVLTNSRKRRTGSQIAKRAENENIELVHNLQAAAKRYFDDDRIDKLINNRFGKAIKKFELEFSKTGGWFKLLARILSSVDGEKGVFELMANYHLLPKGITTKEDFANHLEAELKKEIGGFLKQQNLSDLAISIDLLSTYYNHKIKNNLLSASKNSADLLFDDENFKSRQELFDELFEIGVLIGGKLKGYYECVNCPPNTLSGVLTTNLKPSKLKWKCPNCNNELLFIVPYEIHQDIYEKIVHKDGLLFFAIEYLLHQNEYKYSRNQTFLSDVEIDFCLIDNHNIPIELIEVKMFKTDRPADTQVSNIREAVSKMKVSKKKLTDNFIVSSKIPFSLVTNLTNESVLEQAKIELEKDLRDYNISLYTINEFHKIL